MENMEAKNLPNGTLTTTTRLEQKLGLGSSLCLWSTSNFGL